MTINGARRHSQDPVNRVAARWPDSEPWTGVAIEILGLQFADVLSTH